jgi:D-alanyl-D-alanine carboxypeptidase/D-alanyl-D-alanine-endopeptidase (penicillin-binding protein 4)
MIPTKNRALRQTAMPCFCFLLFTLIFAAPSPAGGVKQPILPKIDRLIANGGYLLGPEDQPLAAKNAHTLFVPASTLKIVTSLGALQMLGEDFHFHTEFYLAGNSDLYIKGYGDPFLTSEEIAVILQALQQQGVGTINNIFLDADAFSLEQQADGRSETLNPYDAANSALAANFNTINFSKRSDGTITSAEPQTPTLPIMLRLGKNLPAGTHRINLTNAHQDILIHTGELFRGLQQRLGIKGQGDINRKTVPSEAKLILTHRSSQPLDQVIAGLLRFSNNFIANQLFLTCGAQQKGYPATWQKSREVFRAFLASLGLSRQQIVMVEGSGLSRNDLVTPAAMVKILQNFRPYAHLLHTDKGRLIKSGTLTGVYCYAGYFPRNAHKIPFVVMLNQPKNLRDQIVNLLEKLPVNP